MPRLVLVNPESPKPLPKKARDLPSGHWFAVKGWNTIGLRTGNSAVAIAARTTPGGGTPYAPGSDIALLLDFDLEHDFGPQQFRIEPD